MTFDRIVCGVDSTPEGFEAARQAARLALPESKLRLVEVVNPGDAAPAGDAGTVSVTELEDEARETLGRTLGEITPVHLAEATMLEGRPIPSLLSELERDQATLLVVGIHHRSRIGGILMASVATTMLHDAPCSVLIARAPADPERFPSSIVVGVDGSPASGRALEAARQVAERFGAGLHGLVAHSPGAPGVEQVRGALGEVRLLEDPRHPVAALVASAADLLVVGSRGLHGLRALGSVSEQVAHQAACSVLVVR